MLDILMVVSEAIPYSKTGGLGDVGGALPAALAHLGHRVTVVTPRYRGIEEGAEVAAFGRGAWLGAADCRVLERVHDDGVRFWFVDCPAYYGRADLYADQRGDFTDNHMRFALLSRAALECAAETGMRPSVVHAHDWQTGLVPVYLRERFRQPSRVRRRGHGVHDSQSRVPGQLRQGSAAAARPAVGRVHG